MKQEPTVKQTNSYQWPSIKTIRDIADAYSSVYEKKEYETSRDKDEDGDNDFADNMIARMVASGMSREEATKKVKNKDYNKKDELDEGIGSAIRGLFGNPKPKPSRGEELRSKYGSPARFGRPPRTPSGEKTKTRYDITLKSSGKEAADKVHGAAFNMLGIAPRDDGSHNPGTVTSGQYRGMGNSANTRMGNPPEDTRPMGIESQVKQGHINSRGVKKPLARSINAEEFELWVNELIEEGYDLSNYTWNELYENYEELNEGIGSAIRGLFGKKKEPEAPKPESRGAELRRRYNTGPDKSDTSAKRKILDKTRARAESDKVKYGNSPYTQSVADKSAAEHERYLRAGYNKYGADRSDSGGMGGSGGSGRGSKAAKRAAALNNSYDLYDLIQSHLLEYGFADTEEGANVIIENMSPSWIKQILSED